MGGGPVQVDRSPSGSLGCHGMTRIEGNNNTDDDPSRENRERSS